ncbi:MAG: hypothetical protein A3F74_10465 [Betaproteobacteria bacterium RIFCSPLOWO2_12_FULL_62_58]|nr:MAG: hypothetical protein A3F74_10465 [Betaproteobacteria bacterium RIFCSPLOWO2_12_FULL_62_58]
MIRTLLRGLAVLETVAQSPAPPGVQRVAEATGLDKATTMRILRTLCAASYLAQHPGTKTYVATDKLHRLALGRMADQDLRDCAHPHLAALRDATGETTHLGVMRDDCVVYIDKLESLRSIRLVSAIGQQMPLHCTGLGKAILAALPNDERNAALRRLTLERRTSRSITDMGTLERELAATRRRGWSVDNQENEDNVTCVAVALTGPRDQVLGAISVSGPTFRVAARRKGIAEALRRAAARIEKDVGKHDALRPQKGASRT